MNAVISKQLKAIFHDPVSIIGMGNMLKRDDAFGSLLAKRLKDKAKKFIIFDVEDGPENYLGKIARAGAHVILIIDAVSFGGRPGELRLFNCEEMQTNSLFFTHNASIGALAQFLKEGSDAHIFLLGAQPAVVSLGEGLTPALENSLNELESLILKLDNQICATRSQAG